MVRTNPKDIAERQDMTRSGRLLLPPWFKLAIATGLALAVVLLASSISTYKAVSRRLIVDHLRADLRAQAVLMEERAQRDSVQTRSQLLAILHEALKKSNGRIAWILVQDRRGEALSAIGAPAAPIFSAQDIRSNMQRRLPTFKTVDSATGRELVEVLPFMLPAGPLRPSPETSRTGLGPVTVEIAESWGAADSALWSVRRQLIINSSAALVLLFSVTTIGWRFRSYLAGRPVWCGGRFGAGCRV
jgi:hypothetical protein